MSSCLKFIEMKIEEIDGEMKEVTVYEATLPNGDKMRAESIRPHVSPEQRAINDAKVCQILYNVLGPKRNPPAIED